MGGLRHLGTGWGGSGVSGVLGSRSLGLQGPLLQVPLPLSLQGSLALGLLRAVLGLL